MLFPLAISNDEWAAFSVLIATIVGAPGGAKIINIIRNALAVIEEVGNLKAEIKELRSLVDVQADEIAMNQMTMIGFVESRDYCMFIMDLKGRTIFLSNAFSRLFGMGKDETINGQFFDAIASVDRERISREWSEYISSLRRTVLLKYKFTDITGQTKACRLKLTRLTLKEGVGRIIGYLTDDSPVADKKAQAQVETKA